jgi:hypothetical protein
MGQLLGFRFGWNSHEICLGQSPNSLRILYVTIMESIFVDNTNDIYG